jgi:RimJ/RimL family protein N-acetyltransferase
MTPVPTISLVQLAVSRAHPARAIHCAGSDRASTLRPLLMSDTEQIERAVSESLSELRRFMPWAHLEQSAVSQLEHRRNTEAEYFAGRDMGMGLFSPDGTLLVCCGLHPRVPLNPRGLELGYWTRSTYARRGLATLAVQIMTVYAFDKLDSDRVQVQHHEDNVGSRRVIEKCGFLPEGVQRNVTTAPTAALIEAGHVATRVNRIWSLVPDDLAQLPWVAELRARLSYVNMAGHPV